MLSIGRFSTCNYSKKVKNVELSSLPLTVAVPWYSRQLERLCGVHTHGAGNIRSEGNYIQNAVTSQGVYRVFIFFRVILF